MGSGADDLDVADPHRGTVNIKETTYGSAQHTIHIPEGCPELYGFSHNAQVHLPGQS